MNRSLLARCALLAISAAAFAQPAGTSPLNPPPNGPRHADSSWNALCNATVHVRPDQSLEHATVVIKDGRIESVLPPTGDQPAEAPPGARVWDCTGLHIYPGFIDAYVEVDAPRPDANQPGVHWNPRVTPQRSALDGNGVDDATAESLRKLGFTVAAISPQGGIFRGRSAVVSLAKPASELSADRPPVYSLNAYHAMGFDLGRGRGFRAAGGGDDVGRWPSYPDSEMGVIALMRQTFIDEQWQEDVRKAGQPLAANAIDSLAPEWARNAPDRTVAAAKVGDKGGLDPMPLLFDCDDELEELRAAKVAREFKRPAILLGSGYEFRRLDAIKEDGLPIVLPLRYPKTPDVSSIGKAESVDLRELMTWEQAPTNPRRLDAAGVKVALTTAKLKDRAEFRDNLTKAIKHGLNPQHALAMLTTQPAEILGVSDRLGTIEPGKAADVVVADGDLFEAWPKAEEKKKPGTEEPGPSQGADGAPKAAAPTTAPPKTPLPPAGEGQQPSGKEGQPESHPDSKTAEKGAEAAHAEKQENQKKDDKPEPKRAQIRDVWIDGVRHEINAAPGLKLEGTWAVKLDPGPDGASLTIDDKNAITVHLGDKKTKARDSKLIDNRLSFVVDDSELGLQGSSLVSGVVEGDSIYGTGIDAEGKPFAWTATRTSKEATPDEPSARAEDAKAAKEGQSVEYMVSEIDGEAKDPSDPGTPIVTIKGDHVTVMLHGHDLDADHVAISGDRIDFTLDQTKIGEEGTITVRATRDGAKLTGNATMPDGSVREFVANQTSARRIEPGAQEQGPSTAAASPQPEAPHADKSAEDRERDAIAAIPETLGYPFGPYMLESLPPQEAVVLTNATIWTEGPKGTIENGWVAIADGKIKAIGSGSLPANTGREIDCRGKHITPGIIDCHSHTGISKGVNEGGEAVSAEVRIADVTDPDSISWYRQLAGGVTEVHSLHGSANAIGGQTLVNKVRWGVPRPDDMHMEGAIPGIKFALGENPKQSNWSNSGNRYPQTRMGVEMLIRDRFTAAQQYLAAREPHKEVDDRLKHANSEADNGIHMLRQPTRLPRSGDLPPRRDLELEALAEVLEGKRLVHCHSYRQDELLMLCRIADDFQFKIGTFQHVLEGYKVADEIASHSGGGSCFSDWWAYKVEVQDAIPQDGPIMHEQGVVVSYNSDSDELARRLNWEAGKAIKYGDHMKPEEALAFVTINPARQLQIDSRVGSLEPGKDADLAVWSGPPMSNFSRCEATYVDGRRLFSLEDDAKAREKIQSERQRIIQKILAMNSAGGGGTPGPAGDHARGRRRPANPSDLEQFYLDLLNRAGNPSAARPGECGTVSN